MKKHLTIEKLTTICQGKVIEKQPLQGGISNLSFLIFTDNGKFVWRIPTNPVRDHLSYINEEKILSISSEKQLTIPPLYYCEGEIVSRYISSNDNTFIELEEMIDIIKSFHQLPLEGIAIFNPRGNYLKYRNKLTDFTLDPILEEKIIHQTMSVYIDNQDLVVAHMDLLFSNFIKGERLYLIDFEYSMVNSLFFDLASLISENELSDVAREKVLSLYFGKVDQKINTKIDIWINFLNLYWAVWAKLEYQLTNKEIFYQIYQDKISKIDKTI